MKRSTNTFFRANVGAVILNSKNEVLAFERARHKEAWQLPQGGVKHEEELYQSVVREVEEETGIKENEIELIAEYPDWLVYEVLKEDRTKKIGRGQAQKWFFFRLKNDSEMKIDLSKAKDKEFINWQWIEMKELIKIVIDFRKNIYINLNKFIDLNIKTKN